MTFKYEKINATKDLVAFCDLAKEKSWLALDTEFVRTKTYYAHLGLVQLATDTHCAVVDPLQVETLTPLWELISSPQLKTVMHAAGEDIEIIRNKHASAPSQMFDSQIAWAFLADGEQIGYAGLVEKRCQVALDKSLSRTDWMARPLSSGQLDYAAADTFYLAKIYPELHRQIQESRWYSLFQQECEFQLNKRSRIVNPDYAWYEVGVYTQMQGRQRAVFAALAKWRLETAQQENIALPFLLKDAVMGEIAKLQPTHKGALAKIEGVHPSILRKRGDAILAAIEQGMSLSESSWPPATPRLDDHSGYKAWFKKAKNLVNEAAVELKVAPQLLGSRKQINEVFVWSQFIPEAWYSKLSAPELLQSWRAEQVGIKLLALADQLK